MRSEPIGDHEELEDIKADIRRLAEEGFTVCQIVETLRGGDPWPGPVDATYVEGWLQVAAVAAIRNRRLDDAV
jgi:hypothetical protein